MNRTDGVDVEDSESQDISKGFTRLVCSGITASSVWDKSEAQDTFVPEGVRILCINDCCHSGTICDIDSFMYSHDIYSISAAKDDEEAEDVGAGGVLSCAMRRAVRTLSLEHGNQAGNGDLQQFFSQKTLPLNILSHPITSSHNPTFFVAVWETATFPIIFANKVMSSEFPPPSSRSLASWIPSSVARPLQNN